MTEAVGSTRRTGLRPPRIRDWLRIRPNRRMPVVVFVWSQTVLLLWWVGEFPGLLSYDSITYGIHVTTGPWTADHSVMYDTMVLASIKLSHSYWPLSLVQTTAWSAVLAYAASSVRQWGVRGRWAALPALILPCLPSFAGFVTTVWKDVAFTLCEVLVVAIILRLLHAWPSATPHPEQQTGGAPISGTAAETQAAPPRRIPISLLVGLQFGFLGLVLLRNNGVLMIPVITIGLLIVLRGLRVEILLIAATSLIALILATAVIYPAANIKPVRSSVSYVTFYADIARIYRKDPSSFTDADLDLMKKAGPLPAWAASARNCYTSDPIYSNGVSLIKADPIRRALVRLWLRVVKRSPVAVIKARLCRSDIAWNPVGPSPSAFAVYTVPFTVPRDLYGRGKYLPSDLARNLESHPLSRGLGNLTLWLREHSSTNWLQPLIWRGATWCYITYLLLAVAAIRLRNRRVLAIGVVSLANQLMVLADNPSQLMRYMAGPVFIGILLVPLAFARPNSSGRAPRTPQDDAEEAAAGASPIGSRVSSRAAETSGRTESRHL